MENETQTSRLLGEYLTQVVQCISEVQAASTSLQDTEARKSLEEFAAMLLDRAGEIAERLEDRTFTVGIIGEFSCGKSTFLNAFTERRYLVEAIEQGTTCAPTRLVYSPRGEVLVQYSNGRTVTMPAGQDMKAFLARVTASEEEGKNITEVRWNTPIPLLRDGLNIIDTPGISSTNPRHTQVAKAVARQCDALIVLTNLLSMPLSKTLIEAVWEIVGKTGRNCLFVGTYCDKLRPREVEKMDGFFRMKLNGSFELPKRPLSLKEGMRRLADAARFLMRFGKNRSEEEAAQEEEPPRRPFYLVSAYKALEELEAEQAGSQGPHAYLQAFREFREEVREKLVTSRQYIQCEKISSLITDREWNMSADILP